MDNESGSIEAKEGIIQGEEPSDTTEARETNPAADSVSTEESEDYSLIGEDDNPSGDSQAALEVEVVLRDDELMVFGDEPAVREFIDSLAISEKKIIQIDNCFFRDLNEQLKKSGTVLQGGCLRLQRILATTSSSRRRALRWSKSTGCMKPKAASPMR